MTKSDFSGKRIAVYGRYSSDKQAPTSADDQIARCVHVVEQRGGVVAPTHRFKDEAISGSKSHRPGLDALMDKVRKRELDLIVVEDLDRLSRDLGDTLAIFDTLAWHDVEMLSVSDGMSTNGPSAKNQVVFKGMMAEGFLAALRDKTFRGQEQRFRNGYATGAVSYGFRTTPKRNLEGVVVAHNIHIDETQAAVVRRVFAEYLAGRSIVHIARLLNAENIPPPRSRKRKGVAVWGDTTIRGMLHNEAYAGVWRYGVRQWGINPENEKRQPRKTLTRPVPDAQIREHLRIIDDPTWTATQARLAAIRAHYCKDRGAHGKSIQGKVSKYLLSGLLICDHCGSLMFINGGDVRRYRCTNNARRGTCANRVTVTEEIARKRIMEALRKAFSSNWGLAYARKVAADQEGDQARSRDKERASKQAELEKTETRIKNLVTQLGDGIAADYVRDVVNTSIARATQLKKELAALDVEVMAPIRLPTPDEVKKRIDQLDLAVQRDVLGAREYLRRLLKNREIRLRAGADGIYTAETEILPLVLLSETPPLENPREAPGSSKHCGGRI